ncbi:CheR family methyltransferase [Nibricoccus sp. IMCC34717]|uniref:CheR family methyltransferase n=1 Tax=Nibricoccus sp. IMCC34717 TaxID=3034021 RepID=UPI00384BAA71
MQPDVLTREQFADFSGLIERELGIQMPDTKVVMLQSRIQRRARLIGTGGVAAYHRRFFSDAAFRETEMEEFFNLATTNKTEFLREAEHFRILRQLVATWRSLGRNRLKVWCAGCSTGEEPYTLAMILADQAEQLGFEFEIVATDVCTRALAKAAGGRYPVAQIAALPAEWRTRYFGPEEEQQRERVVRVKRELRSRITFGHLNFLAPRYGVPGPFDIVFFRNVMIYFSRDTQREVVGRMLGHVRTGGHLFTAHAETLHGLGLPVEQVATAVYQHRPRGAQTTLVGPVREVAC